MSDHTQIGVRVWRLIDTSGRDLGWSSRPPTFPSIPDNPHLAIPLDAESLAGLRERLRSVIGETLRDGDAPPLADVVLAAIGLEPA